MGVIQCIPFYKGYLKVELSDEKVYSIVYIEEKCSYPFNLDISIIKKLVNYSKGFRVSFSDIKVIYPYGTSFEKKVWDITRSIPYGEIRTYKWIAEKLGNKNLSRAVGNALGRNPLLIVVPCHRVIRSNGDLGGFSSIRGLELKRFLLKLEKII